MRIMDEDRVRQIFDLKEKGYTYRRIVSEMKTSDVSVAKYLGMGLEKSLEYVRRKRKEIEQSLPRLSDGEIFGDAKAKTWLDAMDKGSVSTYKTGIGYFCSMVGKKPTELIEEANREIKGGQLLNERGYYTYLPQYEKLLKEETYADTTRSGYMTAVRSFYGFHDIQMPKKKGGRKGKKVRPMKENGKVEITKEDIQSMLDVSKNLRDKGLILAVVSSGLGRAELRELNVSDFVNGYDEETGICMLDDVWRVKTDKDFISFFSTEASSMIWQYLHSERGISKAEAKNHLNEPLFTASKSTWRGSEGLISRLAPVSIDQIFRNIAIRVDVENAPKKTENGNTIFNRLHPHNLRKFFNTQMKLAGCPEIIVEFWMGHAIGATKDAYMLKNKDEMANKYLEFMPAVTIQLTETQVIQSGEYKELSDKAAIYEAALKERNNKIEELENRLEEIDQRIAASQRYQILNPESPLYIEEIANNPGMKVLQEKVIEMNELFKEMMAKETSRQKKL